MNNIDWGLVRSFLRVVQCGSLSSAARSLDVSQPTLTRNIQMIEKQANIQLFQRSTQGVKLTEAGQHLVDAAGKMEDAADQFNRQLSGLSAELEGDVRISANEIMGIHLLPAALVEFQKCHPNIKIELDITNKTSSLSKRDTDIALRMYRPTQPDLVANRLPDLEMGFFATREYIDTHGTPENFASFKQHTIIGFDRDMGFIEGAAAMGYTFTPNDFTFRTDHLLAQLSIARAGGGIVGTHVALAKHWPELVQVLHWVKLPALELWIVCHSDTQYNGRIRSLVHFLSTWFTDNPYKHLN